MLGYGERGSPSVHSRGRGVMREVHGVVADTRVTRISEFIEPLRVEPGSKVVLAKDFDPGYKAGFLKKKEAGELLQHGVELLAEYQDRLAAQDTYGVLVCLQALDAAGKDGTIRHVMSGVNPQGVHVHSFKVPSAEELDHDFLWRYAQRLPGRGEIGIFNRSHYEEVLVVRVHPRDPRPPEAAAGGQGQGRLEASLPRDQRLGALPRRQRLQGRQGLPEPVEGGAARSGSSSGSTCRRRTGSSRPNDAKERAYWDDYQEAFSEMLSHTSTEWAPWYVIPADHKWFARICVSAILAHTLIEHRPAVPDGERRARRRSCWRRRPRWRPRRPTGAAPTRSRPSWPPRRPRRKPGRSASKDRQHAKSRKS